MANYPIPFNKRGTYGIQSVGTPTVTATDVTVQFASHPFVQFPYNGELIVEITTGVATGTADALPVFFQTGNGAKVAATKAGGAPLVGADIELSGFYHFFYDRSRNILQAFNSVS